MHACRLRPAALLPALVAAAAGLALVGCQSGRLSGPALPVEEDFDGGCSRWTEEATDTVALSCEDGEYRILVKEAGAHTALLAIPETTAVAAEADVRLEEGSGRGGDVFGVSCNAGEAGYLFIVQPDGYWAIAKERGRDLTLLREAQAQLERAGRGKVRVRGECAARTGATALAISVDGRRLSVVHDRSGLRAFDAVGVSAGTSEGGVDVRFDNFRAAALDKTVLARVARDTGAGDAEPLRLVDESELPVHIDDDFSEPESGWPRERTRFARLAYERGAYAVTLDGRPNHAVLRAVGETPAVVVEASLAQGTRRADQGFGLACYTADASAGYVFSVSGSGGYAIFAARAEQAAGERFDVVARGIGPGERHEEPVRLRAECAVGEDGTHLVLFVGGERWARAVDEQGIDSLGAAGLYVSRERATTRVFFDDVVVRALGDPGKTPVVETRAPVRPAQTAPPPPPTRALFRGEEREWTLEGDGVVGKARNGVIRLRFRDGGLTPETLAREVPALRIEADVKDETRGQGPVEHGLACSHEGDGSPASTGGYVFTIDPGTGTYRIERWFASAVAELVTGKRRAAIRARGRTNRLRVECRAIAGATRLVLFVNGQQLARHDDARGVQIRRFDTLQYATDRGATTRFERVRADALPRGQRAG